MRYGLTRITKTLLAAPLYLLVGCGVVESNFFLDECVTLPAMEHAYGQFLQDPLSIVSNEILEADLTIHAYKIETRKLDDSERERAVRRGALPLSNVEELKGEFLAASHGDRETKIEWRRFGETSSPYENYFQTFVEGHRLYRSGLYVGYESDNGVVRRLLSFNRFHETADSEYTHIELVLDRVGAMKRIGCIFPSSSLPDGVKA